MRELTEFLKLYAATRTPATEKFLTTVERLYFNHSTKILPTLRHAEEYRLARDLVTLEGMLQQSDNILGFKPKSNHMKQDETIKRYRKEKKLDPAIRQLIKDEAVQPVRPVVSAVVLVEIVQRENRKEFRRWLLTFLVALLTATLTLMIKLLGDPNVIPTK